MARYKVGDEVVIRSDLKDNMVYGSNTYFECMLTGKRNIIYLSKGEYKLEGCIYKYTDEMIDHEATARLNRTTDSNDYIRFIMNNEAEKSAIDNGLDIEHMGGQNYRIRIEPTDSSDTFANPGNTKRDISNLGDKECIHCKTKEEAKAICKLFHESGKTWRDGETYLEEDCRGFQGLEICYTGDGWHGSRDFYKTKGYTILPASDFIEEEVFGAPTSYCDPVDLFYYSESIGSQGTIKKVKTPYSCVSEARDIVNRNVKQLVGLNSYSEGVGEKVSRDFKGCCPTTIMDPTYSTCNTFKNKITPFKLSDHI